MKQVWYHANCYDGFGAAWVGILRRAGLHPYPTRYKLRTFSPDLEYFMAYEDIYPLRRDII